MRVGSPAELLLKSLSLAACNNSRTAELDIRKNLLRVIFSKNCGAIWSINYNNYLTKGIFLDVMLFLIKQR